MGESNGTIPGFTLIPSCDGYPVKILGRPEELKAENVRRGQGNNGIVRQIVDVPQTPNDTILYMHPNHSLDHGIVLKGSSIELVLDSGTEKAIREGDVYVQR